jgi:hypothetical protein
MKLKFCVICLCREILSEIAQLLRQHLLATVKHSYDIQERNTGVSVPTQKSNATIYCESGESISTSISMNNSYIILKIQTKQSVIKFLEKILTCKT